MNKNEFMEYVSFLKELFPRVNIPKSKDGLTAWYKAFENTHINVAKEMAQIYLQEEQNGFNYARLLAYKSRVIANRGSLSESQDKKYECMICNSTGVVQVEVDVKGHTYLRFYRCNCENGTNISDKFKLVTEELLEDKIFECGVFKIKNMKNRSN